MKKSTKLNKRMIRFSSKSNNQNIFQFKADRCSHKLIDDNLHLVLSNPHLLLHNCKQSKLLHKNMVDSQAPKQQHQEDFHYWAQTFQVLANQA